MGPSSRVRLAVCVSALTHVGVLAFVARARLEEPPARPVVPEVSVVSTVEFELARATEVPALRTEKRDSTSTAAPGPRLASRPAVAPRREGTSAPRSVPPVEAPQSATFRAEPKASDTVTEATAPALVPSLRIPGAPLRGPFDEAPQLEHDAERTARFTPGGRTLRPGDGPTPEEVEQENVARGQAMIDGFALQTVRRHRAQFGLVDARYDEVRRELAAGISDVPDLVGLDDPKAVARAVVDAWAAGAERYGATGAPYETPPGWRDEAERPAEFLRLAQGGSQQMQTFVQFLSAGARLQEFADGRAGKELVAFVALRQGPDGALLSLELAQPSGLRTFDDWVMKTAGDRLSRFRFDAGAREKPVSSVWRFTGRVSFMRKGVSPPAVRDLATTIPLMALSALTGGRVPIALGRFDEVEGTVETLDFATPHYECHVTLLEAE